MCQRSRSALLYSESWPRPTHHARPPIAMQRDGVGRDASCGMLRDLADVEERRMPTTLDMLTMRGGLISNQLPGVEPSICSGGKPLPGARDAS